MSQRDAKTGKWLRTAPDVFCIICEKVITGPNRTNNRKFCSKVCFGLARRGMPSPALGFRWSPELRAKMSLKHKGQNVGPKSGHWKGGVTPLYKQMRKSKEYKTWRFHVYERDNYTCQSCNKRGGKLTADHELPFAHYPELRFEILNGRTLCESCHRLTPTWGRHSDFYTSTFKSGTPRGDRAG